MLMSFSEFKFYQSFRIPVEKADDIRFLVSFEGPNSGVDDFIDDAGLVDLSMTGLGFSTKERLSTGQELSISLQFRKLHLELSGKIVRAFTSVDAAEKIIYGVEYEEEDSMRKFLETFINSFTPDRLKNCLADSALRERYSSATEGFEMLSLLLSLFRDLTNFSSQENFIENLLDEVSHILNAQRATAFLINPETNELEAISAMGVDKSVLKFDYRQGIAGSVFTTGVSLNIDTANDQTRFDESFDKLTGFKTKSIVCNPIYNREDKVIGVLQVLNKRNEDRFTAEDEKTMKVISLVFSSLFHNFNPISEKSQIRRFSTPFDRKFVLIGKTPVASKIRSSITKLKDIDCPVLIHGEDGVGKTLLGEIIHHEGSRGLNKIEKIHCGGLTDEVLSKKLFGSEGTTNPFEECQGGTILLQHIHLMSLPIQKKLIDLLNNGGLEGSKLTIDARLVCTTSQDLQEMVTMGSFNRELYAYLSQAYVFMEPLRKRRNDIKYLVEYFLKVECKKQGLLLKSFTEPALESFMEYDWPGNVAELRTCVERAVLYNPKAHIIGDLSNSATPLFDKSKSALKMFDDIPYVSDTNIALKDRVILVERKMIDAEIRRNNNNKSLAAKTMGISREALRKKLIQSDEVMGRLNGEAPDSKDEKKAA